MANKGLGRVALVVAVLAGVLAFDAKVSLAQSPPLKEVSECLSGELIARRTRDSRTVLHSDCSYTTTFGPNLHYEVAPGRWGEVDLRFRRDGAGHVADRNSTIVRVAGARLDVTDRETGKGIRWLLPDTPSVRGHRARFESHGLQWEYAVTDLGVKLEADVATSRGPQTYEFSYHLVGDGDALVVDERGGLRGDGFSVPRAFALGADGETYEAGSWQLLQGRRAAFDFDDSVLPQEAFPYVLDPTTSFNPTAAGDEGNVTKSGFPYPPSSCAGWSDSGSTTGPERSSNAKPDLFWTTNGFMSWDTSSLPDNATVTSSTLKFYSRAKADSNSRSLTADWYSAWPIDCSDFSDSAQTSAISGLPLANIRTPNVDTIATLSGAASGISRTGRTGLRTHVSGGQPNGPNSLEIWQLGNASNMPSSQLNVDYSIPGGPPAIVSATDSPDPVVAGLTTTFTVAWSDSDPGDSVRALICKTNAVTSGSCSGGAWASGGLSTTSPSSASYATSTADRGTRSYYAFACDQSNACSGSLSGTFTVTAPNSAPVVTFNVTPTSGNRDTTFQAQLSGHDPDGDPLSYRIDWGDGTISNSATASHVYRTAGTYTVTGTVTDSKGASSSQSKTVTVEFSNHPPTASITVDPKQGDTSTNFSAQVSGTDPEGDPLTFAIDWGDGTETNGQNGTHKYTEPGSYVVTGIVSDAYGATAKAFDEVQVCTAMANGTCVQPPVDPCEEVGIACGDKPTHYEFPEQVRALFQDQEVPVTFSPDGTVLALSANVRQVYADDGGSCAVANPKLDCGQAHREGSFAQRVLALSQKEDDDGMGAVPDLLLLQEVRRLDLENIISELTERGLNYAIGSGRAEQPDNDRTDDHEVSDQAAGINKMCNKRFNGPNEADDRRRCKENTYMHADTAILYNTDTMMPLLAGTVDDYYDATYDFDHHRPCQNSSHRDVAPRVAMFDADKDEEDDCRVKWLRQYTGSFTKFDVDDNGVPTDTLSTLVVAAASVHLIERSHFNREDDHAAHKRKVASQLAVHLWQRYGPVERIMGGDWNIHRCSNKIGNVEDPDVSMDYPTDDQSCAQHTWWAHLTSERPYQDAVYTARAAADGDRLEPQYRDGCEELSENEGCVPNYRHQRIDFVWNLGRTVPEGTEPGGTVTDASHDLSCGEVMSQAYAPNCSDVKNPERYSDHRLVWGLFDYGTST